jgi:hypothetical protein
MAWMLVRGRSGISRIKEDGPWWYDKIILMGIILPMQYNLQFFY